ncbi:MAG TPA: HAMP domain-containing sensor histidine kinase [Verrucomicrobiae bacterium]|nr:HAMP domain-containing sensor histidine kinase [Verrucomicrobiae bacterium]
MLKPRLYRTTTFRLALLYAGLFSLSVVALFALVYWTAESIDTRDRHNIIESDIRELLKIHQSADLATLAQSLVDRALPAGGGGLYLLAGPNLEPIAGNILGGWPRDAELKGDWMRFQFGRAQFGDLEPYWAEAKAVALEGGNRLLVGRRIESQFQAAIFNAFAASLVLMIVLGAVVGFLMSRTILRRIEVINDAADRIKQGEVKRRMPVRGSDDEFDRLAQNLNAMLEEIERLMGSIRAATNNIAHDLRSPLNRLRNRLEAMHRQLPEPALQEEELEHAIGDIDGLLQTFNALLSIADAEAGAGRGNLVPVDLAALTHDVAELYGALVEDHGLKFDSTIRGPAMVTGNRQLLFQAIGNLIDNAAKYGASGGAVSLELRPAVDGAGPCVIVGDRGPGIPEEDRSRVLERFVRLDASRTSPGNGLGLSLVAAIARLHSAGLKLGDNKPGLKVTLQFNPAASAG